MKQLNCSKIIMLSVLLCFGIFSGCNRSHSSKEFVKVSTNGIMVDTSKLINMLNTKFKADTVLKYFGPGTHSFYMVVGRGADSDHLTYLFTRNIGLIGVSSPEVLIRDILQIGSHGSLFEQGFFDNDKIFRVRNTTDKVIGVYEIRIGIDNTKRVIYPWTVDTPDLDKYQPKFYGNYKRNEFSSNSFPRALIGGYEELSKKISYPEEARKLGVSGRIMVTAFVDERGNVVGTQLSHGIGFGCDEVALAAVRLIKFYPSDFGKSEVILPIDFALEYVGTSFDLTSTKFKFDPAEKTNNISFNLVNIGKLPSPDSKTFIYLYIDKKLAFASIIPKVKKEVVFWTRWDKVTKGVHEYTISIDPLNNLKETNRNNNIVAGTFEVK